MDEKFLLILQPMTKAEVLRYWLTNNEFGITDEKIVRDAGERYQIIGARFGGNTPLTDAELFTGEYKLAVKNELFDEQLESLIKRFEKAVDGMDRARGAVGWLNVNRGILGQLYKMRDGEGEYK